MVVDRLPTVLGFRHVHDAFSGDINGAVKLVEGWSLHASGSKGDTHERQ